MRIIFKGNLQKWQKILIVTALSVTLLFFLLPAVLMALELTPLKLRVDGIKSFGLTVDESLKKIRQELQRRNESYLSFQVNKERIKVTPGETGFLIDVERTLKNLEDKLKEKNLYFRYLYYLENTFWGSKTHVIIKKDSEKFGVFCEKINLSYGRPYRNAYVEFDSTGKARFHKEETGISVDPVRLEKKIKKSLIDRSIVPVDLVEEPPQATLKDIKDFVKDNLPSYEKKELVLISGGKTRNISGSELLSVLRSEVRDSRIIFAVNPEKLSEVAKNYFRQIEKSPEPARFIVEGSQIKITPDKPGYAPDSTATAIKATEMLRISDYAEVEVQFREIRADITYEKAKTFGIKEQIASFSTDYNPHQTARVENIKLLAALLDGMLIAPGEVFSFNERIGPRTLERGFRLAPTIINGRLVDTAGGGACQVGTTLFNTAFFAGLEIVERHNHSFFISHYPAGRDATVSYGGYDLKFKNDYKSWILIKAHATQSRITIAFYGTKENRKVEYRTEGPFDFKPFKVETIKDPNLDEGKTIIEDKGITGRKYIVVRFVYDEKGNLIHKDTFRSNYSPKIQIVRVGTRKVLPQESTQTTEPAI